MKQRRKAIALFCLIVIGILLRMTFVGDMEYKEDEEYDFTQSQLIGVTEPWPAAGIPSGVYLPNPGMSIWVFAVLARITGASTPTQLASALQAFALLGMCLIIPFVLFFLPKGRSGEKETRLWLWALALALVNPFLVFYQRKLWPESFLPFFVMLTLMGWWRRKDFWPAFFWGLFGAWLGQIHMSGFFYAFALFAWTATFSRKAVRWSGWFTGSVLGALPLVPWALYVYEHPFSQSMTSGLQEILQFKYWTFWLTDPTGLHLGNPLGLLRGESNLTQISDFIRYPILFGHATFIVGIAHALVLGCCLAIFGRRLLGLRKKARTMEIPSWKDVLIGRTSPTAFVLSSALIGSGMLMTLTGVVIRRYYMAITFPLEFIFLVWMADPSSRWGKRALRLLVLGELIISIGFVHYIHVNEGSTWGDYGMAYHRIMSEREASIPGK